MAYKLRCNTCGNTFVTRSRNGNCPRNHSSYSTTEFIGDVLDAALDVATAVAVAHVTGDIFSGAADVVGSLFDW
jgi:hypothetical protein